MNKISIALAISLFLGLFGCQNNTSNPVQIDPIKGLWALNAMELKDSVSGKWSTWRDGMQGYLLYDGTDNVSLHLMPVGYELNQSKFRNFTDTLSLDKLKHLSQNYNYMGKYLVDSEKQIVSHHRLSHSNPNDWGVTVQRRFEFSGDTLIIKPVESKNARLRLKWLKK